MNKALLLLPLLLIGSACALTPEKRVRTALIDAGVPSRVAGCMAERMVRRLSIGQLQQLKSLANVTAPPGEAPNPKHILRSVEAIGDPEIVRVTTRAALGCYIAG